MSENILRRKNKKKATAGKRTRKRTTTTACNKDRTKKSTTSTTSCDKNNNNTQQILFLFPWFLVPLTNYCHLLDHHQNHLIQDSAAQTALLHHQHQQHQHHHRHHYHHHHHHLHLHEWNPISKKIVLTNIELGIGLKGNATNLKKKVKMSIKPSKIRVKVYFQYFFLFL